MEPELGQLVVSAAGRDKGRYYVVMQIVDDTTVTVADGTYRPVSKPKKKNIRHLMMTRMINKSLNEKLLAGIGPTNEEVREVLKINNKAKSERMDCSHG
jgi:ribosomal protein L14E/L6E/L27E